MLRALLTYFLIFFNSVTFAQQSDTDCWQFNSEKALKDIGDKKPLMLLQSGDASVIYLTDKDFEKKYRITFHDFGCVALDKEECLIAYNRTVFEYLDKTFGNKWRKEIRKDVIGLKRK